LGAIESGDYLGRRVRGAVSPDKDRLYDTKRKRLTLGRQAGHDSVRHLSVFMHLHVRGFGHRPP